jgi:hypothetical protein
VVGNATNPIIGPVGGRLMGAPPNGEHIAYFNGRIYIAERRTLWATEMYDYHRIDKTKNYKQFEYDITCLAAVSDGLYVGTTNGLFFLTGPLDTMKRTKLFDHAVVPYSAVLGVDPSMVDGKLNGNSGVMLLSSMGLHLCLDGGTEINITGKSYLFPKADTASAILRSQDGINQVIVSTHGSGSPASAARFGDFVDAEIRRFNGACYATR